MKDVHGKITYHGTDYRLVFNLNVMEAIQEEYGTVERWGELTDGTATGEGNARAIKFGFAAMINEGIEIENDEKGTNVATFSLPQVGRILSEIGLENAAKVINKTVVESTQSEEKNA